MRGPSCGGGPGRKITTPVCHTGREKVAGACSCPTPNAVSGTERLCSVSLAAGVSAGTSEAQVPGPDPCQAQVAGNTAPLSRKLARCLVALETAQKEGGCSGPQQPLNPGQLPPSASCTATAQGCPPPLPDLARHRQAQALSSGGRSAGHQPNHLKGQENALWRGTGKCRVQD